jgi:hypothetical protein
MHTYCPRSKIAYSGQPWRRIDHARVASGFWVRAYRGRGAKALGKLAFHWSVSPWFVALKQALAGWLIDHHVLWPLRLQPPWWVLTDYPSVNDQMTFLDGATLLAYIMATAIAVGAPVSLCLWIAARSLGPSPGAKFHHSRKASFRSRPAGFFLGSAPSP